MARQRQTRRPVFLPDVEVPVPGGEAEQPGKERHLECLLEDPPEEEKCRQQSDDDENPQQDGVGLHLIDDLAGVLEDLELGRGRLPALPATAPAPAPARRAEARAGDGVSDRLAGAQALLRRRRRREQGDWLEPEPEAAAPQGRVSPV